MFEWKVEEMKLLNEINKVAPNIYRGKYIFECEKTLSKEEKIAFIDSYWSKHPISRLLEIINKFNNEKDSLPKDNYGNVKTVSLIAWVKRNNAISYVDNYYHYGQINYYGLERYITWNNVENSKGYYDTHENIVDEVFHRLLSKHLIVEEERYFTTHDEYEVLKTEFKSDCLYFNNRIGMCSNGQIYVYDKDSDNRRDITIDELKMLIEARKKVRAYEEELSKSVNIEF